MGLGIPAAEQDIGISMPRTVFPQIHPFTQMGTSVLFDPIRTLPGFSQNVERSSTNRMLLESSTPLDRRQQHLSAGGNEQGLYDLESILASLLSGEQRPGPGRSVTAGSSLNARTREVLKRSESRISGASDEAWKEVTPTSLQLRGGPSTSPQSLSDSFLAGPLLRKRAHVQTTQMQDARENRPLPSSLLERHLKEISDATTVSNQVDLTMKSAALSGPYVAHDSFQHSELPLKKKPFLKTPTGSSSGAYGIGRKLSQTPGMESGDGIRQGASSSSLENESICDFLNQHSLGMTHGEINEAAARVTGEDRDSVEKLAAALKSFLHGEDAINQDIQLSPKAGQNEQLKCSFPQEIKVDPENSTCSRGSHVRRLSSSESGTGSYASAHRTTNLGSDSAGRLHRSNPSARSHFPAGHEALVETLKAIAMANRCAPADTGPSTSSMYARGGSAIQGEGAMVAPHDDSPIPPVVASGLHDELMLPSNPVTSVPDRTRFSRVADDSFHNLSPTDWGEVQNRIEMSSNQLESAQQQYGGDTGWVEVKQYADSLM